MSFTVCERPEYKGSPHAMSDESVAFLDTVETGLAIRIRVAHGRTLSSIRTKLGAAARTHHLSMRTVFESPDMLIAWCVKKGS